MEEGTRMAFAFHASDPTCAAHSVSRLLSLVLKAQSGLRFLKFRNDPESFINGDGVQRAHRLASGRVGVQ